VPSIRHVVVMADDGPTPDGKLDYERLIAAESADYAWPVLDERSACAICYTSGVRTGRSSDTLDRALR
jgi:fatty-acyl-CoA synthase